MGRQFPACPFPACPSGTPSPCPDYAPPAGYCKNQTRQFISLQNDCPSPTGNKALTKALTMSCNVSANHASSSRSRRDHARRYQSVMGQFWTPDWLAAVMVEYVLFRPGLTLFDPAVGAGVFFHVAWQQAKEKGFPVFLRGMEIDPDVLPRMIENDCPVTVTFSGHETVATGEAAPGSCLPSCLPAMPEAEVQVGDFLLSPPLINLEAVVANPPYIRHHRILPEKKKRLRQMVWERTGLYLDGRAGLHVYFLIHTLTRMLPGGRLAYLLPADVCEGRFAPALWNWIIRHFICEAVLTFTPESSPFPRLNIQPLVLFLRRPDANVEQSSPPVTSPSHLSWGVCQKADSLHIRKWVSAGFPSGAGEAITAIDRSLDEALVTGLSRSPSGGGTPCDVQDLATASQFGGSGWRFVAQVGTASAGAGGAADIRLGEIVQIKRGIVTGSNDFFVLNDQKVKELGLPENWLRPCIGRVRDIPDDHLTVAVLDRLRARGRPVWLLSLEVSSGWDATQECPPALREYLAEGKNRGLPLLPLLCRRRPWFRMESRPVPPFLFAYLARRRSRFIRNLAEVVPLNCFLCLYPRPGVNREWLWQVLTTPEVLDGLPLVGKSYGGGVFKVEPRLLERLVIPGKVLKRLPPPSPIPPSPSLFP